MSGEGQEKEGETANVEASDSWGLSRPHGFYDFFSGYYEKPDRIEEGLYLGGLSSVSNKEHLRAMNITSILTVARGLAPRFPDDFTYTVIEVWDSEEEDLMKHFECCFEAIDRGREKGGIVVHCMAGVSRSVTITVAYIMRLYSISWTKALAYVRRCRSCASPNPGFIRQLQQYGAKLAAEKELSDKELTGVPAK